MTVAKKRKAQTTQRWWEVRLGDRRVPKKESEALPRSDLIDPRRGCGRVAEPPPKRGSCRLPGARDLSTRPVRVSPFPLPCSAVPSEEIGSERRHVNQSHPAIAQSG